MLLPRSTLGATIKCKNGGTLKKADQVCICTPDFYGENCETSFTSSDPCSSLSIPVIKDPNGAHSPRSNKSCSETMCVDFSKASISTGWYRVKSPAGDVLSTACPDSPNGCGSLSPFIVTNMVQEDNADRNLFTAKLSPVSIGFKDCHDPESLTYPVRILMCTSYKLYYLGPTVQENHQYCIGHDKRKCNAGLFSRDGSGYEPCYTISKSACIPTLKLTSQTKPAIQQEREASSSSANRTDFYTTSFNFKVEDSFDADGKGDILYRVLYRLTYPDTTSTVIDACTVKDLSIKPEGSETVSCQFKNLLVPNRNVYGSTLECVVQARCNSSMPEYNSHELVSMPHKFEFTYGLVDLVTSAETSVITPSSPVKLCVNIFKVPFINNADIRVTVRQKTLLDRSGIKLLVKSSIESDKSSTNTDPCAIPLIGMNKHYTPVCTLLVLQNENEGGFSIRGLNSSEQDLTVEVKVSYRSSSKPGGIFTAGKWRKLQSRMLTVNISSLYANATMDYFHIYRSDHFKPANSRLRYRHDKVASGKCKIVSLMQSKILPYGVQALLCSDPNVSGSNAFVTKVAIRYEYYVITLESINKVLNYSTRLLKNGQSALYLTAAKLPLGVTVNLTGKEARVKFDFYGTVIRVMLSCPPKGLTCTPGAHQLVVNDQSASALNLMIFPGSYDTPSRVDGVLYRPDIKNWTSTDTVEMDGRRDMFSSKFVADKVTENLLKPTQWLNFCTCTDGNTAAASAGARCAIKVNKVSRTKRSTFQKEMLESASTHVTQPIVLHLYNTGVLCSTKNCTSIYLSVSPYIISAASPSCIIRSIDSGYEETSVSKSVADKSADIVSCSMANVQLWLKKGSRPFMALTVKLTDTDWSSSNSVSILAYQESCKNGAPVCSTASMSCFINGTPGTTDDADKNTCENPVR